MCISKQVAGPKGPAFSAEILNSGHINQPIDFLVDLARCLFDNRTVLSNHVDAFANLDEPCLLAAGEIRMEYPRSSCLSIVGLPIPAVEGECDPLIGFGEMTLKIPSAWDFAY